MGVFDGIMGRDSSTIKGQWKQLGQSMPLTLQRIGGAPAPPDSKDPWLKKLGRELRHEGGYKKGRTGLASVNQYYVRFETPEPDSYLKAVRIFGMRPTDAEPAEPNFHIFVCDANFEAIEDFQFPVDKFAVGDANWVTLTIEEPTNVPSKFAVGLNQQEKALVVGWNPGRGSNSFFKLPGRKARPYARGNWLIRTIVSQSPEMPKPTEPKWPTPKWSLPDFKLPDIEDFANKYGSEKTVKLKIAGVTDDAIEDVIIDRLKRMTDESTNWMEWKRKDDFLNVELAPVANVKDFEKKIAFGTVIKTEGRELTIQAKEDWKDKDFRFGDDPDKTVRLEIIGVTDDAAEDAIKQKLQNMTDGSGYVLTCSRIRTTLTANLAPVSDVQAFIRKIEFGTITNIRGRRIVVQVAQPTE
jgi:hypothetical protein